MAELPLLNVVFAGAHLPGQLLQIIKHRMELVQGALKAFLQNLIQIQQTIYGRMQGTARVLPLGTRSD
jgi:hypothetical protein